MEKAFDKPSLMPKELLERYQKKGLIVKDTELDLALTYFKYVGAYRLKGYMHHFLSTENKQFPEEFRFEYLRQQYECDRELRGLIINAIDRIEVAIRSVMSNYLSLKHGAHWFLNESIFIETRTWNHSKVLQKISSDVQNASKKTFIKHYYQNYNTPDLPPSWAVSEVISFGFWSKTYSILTEPTDKKAISMKFGVDQPEVFQSWIHALSVVRNHAAHHSQILRTPIRVKPTNYKRKKICFAVPESFATMQRIIEYFLREVKLPNTWSEDLTELFKKYPLIKRIELEKY